MYRDNKSSAAKSDLPRVPWMAACVLSLALFGCGPQGPERQAVVGTVKIDGKPASGLTIIFAPIDSGAVGAAATVDEGQFEIAREHGPSVGKHDVKFEVVEPELEEFEMRQQQGERPLSDLRIAPKFTRSGTLSKEIQAGGENRFEFELTSR